MAMNLLTAVQGNPNLPPQFKETAISVANNAIVFANQELAKLPADQTPVQQPVTPVVVPVAPVQPPVVGGIITPMDKSSLDVEVTEYRKKDIVNGQPFGHFSISVSVKDKDGKNLRQEIVMDAPDNLLNKTVDTVKIPNSETNVNKGDWTASFGYVPVSEGQKVITFTSGNLKKQVTINVY